MVDSEGDTPSISSSKFTSSVKRDMNHANKHDIGAAIISDDRVDNDDPDSVASKLYQRITSKLIPPIQQSIHNLYSHPHTPSKDLSPEPEDSSDNQGVHNDDDEEDVANVVDVMKTQKNIFDIISSSQIYSDVYKFVHPRYRSDSKASSKPSLRKNDSKILGYGIVDYSSDDEEEVDEYQSHELSNSKEDIINNENEIDDHSITDSAEFEDAVESKDSDETFINKGPATLRSTNDSTESTATFINSLNIDDKDPINLDELSVFQQSILQNLSFQYDGGVLMKHKYKSGFENLENIDDEQVLKVKSRVADRLQKVFKLNDDDFFYSGYSTWLVRDVFLQGHIYLTRDCLLYFAFLPEIYSHQNTNINNGGITKHDDSNMYIQTGVLTMKTKKYGEILSTVLTTRLWAILRPETLSIYSNAKDLYFPTLVIDLRTCKKVEILDKYNPHVESTSSPTYKNSWPIDSPGIQSPREAMSRRNSNDNLMDHDEEELTKILAQEAEENKDSISGGVWFKITTHKKSYKFQTDNMYSAREWVNNITKLMFQIHNSNSKNEVLIKIPFDNIVKYGRKNIFTGATETEQFDDQAPSTYAITYTNPNANLGRPHKILNEKAKTKMGLTNDFEVLFFAFFTKSDEFNETFTKILKDREADDENKSQVTIPVSKHSSMSKSNEAQSLSSPRNKAKTYADADEIISTLTPGGNSSNIIEQLTSTNKDLEELYNSPLISGLNNNEKPSSRIKKISKSLSSKVFSPTSKHHSKQSVMSHMNHEVEFSSPSISNLSTPASIDSSNNSISSSPKNSYLVSPADSSDRSSFLTCPTNLNLPRQLSLTGLKNLNMSFETSNRKLQVAEDRYYEAVADEKLGKNITTNSKGETVEDAAVELRSTISINPILPGPLNLSDPSEYSEFDRKRDNKLKAIGKSLKSLSNVTNVWNAQPSHYIKLEDDDPFYITDESSREIGDKHFRSHFSLPNNYKLSASYFCHVQRALPIYGKLYVGDEVICFRSLLPGVSTRMILPLRDVKNCYKSRATKITYSCLTIVIKGYEKLIVEFSNQKSRDDCSDIILEMLHRFHSSETWKPMAHEWGVNYDLELGKERLLDEDNESNYNLSFKPSEETLKQASLKIENARIKMFEDRLNAAAGIQVPIVLEDSPFTKTEIKPATSYNFVLLTIGSRGDVQPYIALAKGLISEGHKVTIATHEEFKDWIVGHNIGFKEIAGDPTELMSLMVTHGSMSVAFIKEASAKFKGWINDLLKTSWIACQGADILIESPSAMGGVHVAEALGIPYMRAFTMPWTRTRAYSHAFILPDQKKGGSYNYLTHVMFETVYWKGISSQVNKWRVESLGLPKTNLFKLQQGKIPFLYNVSSTVLPPAVDFPDWIKVTGYWFLDEGTGENYQPPENLLKFIEQARMDRKKVVYIGFGSIVVNDAKSLTDAVINAVLDADVRCILNKGWSDRSSKDKHELERELPAEIFNSGSVPHDWLFPRIDAAVHHGGSGTTGATLRSGLPTIIKPFFGDQFFYASRVEEIGAGIALRKLNSKSLSRALTITTTDIKMIERAKRISEEIKNEHGVLSAIEEIYSQLEYARSLIINKQLLNEKARLNGYRSGTQTPSLPVDDLDPDSDSEVDSIILDIDDTDENLDDDDGISIDIPATSTNH